MKEVVINAIIHRDFASGGTIQTVFGILEGAGASAPTALTVTISRATPTNTSCGTSRPSDRRQRAVGGGEPIIRLLRRPFAVIPPADPLDELVAGGALDQGVGDPVDVFGTRQFIE